MAMRVLLIFLACCWGPLCCRGEDAAESLRVATYNLNWANRHLGQVVDAIRACEADVVFIQETTPESERFLHQQLSDSHPHMHFVGHRGQFWAERFGFVSKIPLRDLSFDPPDAGLFGNFVAVCDVGGARVTLVNVHLSPFLFHRGEGIRNLMAAMNETEDKHAAEIAAICRRFDPRQPAIIAGDFNSLSTFKAPSHLTDLGLIDSFASVHDDPDTHVTWRWPTRPLPMMLRIDYVFHTSHFRTVQSQVLTRPGSDHSLVVSELSLVNSPDAIESD